MGAETAEILTLVGRAGGFRKHSRLRPKYLSGSPHCYSRHTPSPPSVPMFTSLRSLSQRKAVWEIKSVCFGVAAPPDTTPNLLTPYPKLYPPPSVPKSFTV